MRKLQHEILTLMSGGAGASPLLTGLVAYWKLDESSGNRLDSVGTRHMLVAGTVGAVAGKIGNAATAAYPGNAYEEFPRGEMSHPVWDVRDFPHNEKTRDAGLYIAAAFLENT